MRDDGRDDRAADRGSPGDRYAYDGDPLGEEARAERVSALIEAMREERTLAPVTGRRGITPHSCAFCAEGIMVGDGSFMCARPDGPTFDVGDGEQYTTTCDRWRAAPAHEGAQRPAWYARLRAAEGRRTDGGKG